VERPFEFCGGKNYRFRFEGPLLKTYLPADDPFAAFGGCENRPLNVRLYPRPREVIAATAKSARRPADCDDSLVDELFRSGIWAIRSQLWAIWLLAELCSRSADEISSAALMTLPVLPSILVITSPACAAIGAPK
jgi:hypothetical protein